MSYQYNKLSVLSFQLSAFGVFDAVSFAPLDGDVAERSFPIGVPILFAAIAAQRVLEIAEGAGAMDGVLQLVAKPLGFDGLGELAHDLPLVDSVLRG
jgi:hypothetical protein